MKQVVHDFACACKKAGMEVWLDPAVSYGIYFDPKVGGIDDAQPIVYFQSDLGVISLTGEYEACKPEHRRHVGRGWHMEPLEDWSPEAIQQRLLSKPPFWASDDGKYPVRSTKPTRSICLFIPGNPYLVQFSGG